MVLRRFTLTYCQDRHRRRQFFHWWSWCTSPHHLLHRPLQRHVGCSVKSNVINSSRETSCKHTSSSSLLMLMWTLNSLCNAWIVAPALPTIRPTLPVSTFRTFRKSPLSSEYSRRGPPPPPPPLTDAWIAAMHLVTSSSLPHTSTSHLLSWKRECKYFKNAILHHAKQYNLIFLLRNVDLDVVIRLQRLDCCATRAHDSSDFGFINENDVLEVVLLSFTWCASPSSSLQNWFDATLYVAFFAGDFNVALAILKAAS